MGAGIGARRGGGAAGAWVAIAAVAGLAAAGLVEAPAPVAWPVQDLGNQGTDVAAIQLLLDHHGALRPVTGTFDEATASAVRAFQQDRGLAADGIVGPLTWRALAPLLHEGDLGPGVAAVQHLLNEKRAAGLPPHGLFDAATRAAVVDFQAHQGIAADGVVGPTTWLHLAWHYEPVDTALPWVCGYRSAEARWGTGAAVGQLERAALQAWSETGQEVAVGDLSLEHGGDIAGHVSHALGLDADLRLPRGDGAQCEQGCTWRQACYDQASTRALIEALRDHAPGHLRLILFNDPDLVAEGLTVEWPNHDDHLHVRWCERMHASALYDC